MKLTTSKISTISSLFELIKPKGIGIGFDALPIELLDSNLTGNQLAQMASIPNIPKLNNKTDKHSSNYSLKDLIKTLSILIDDGKTLEAWNVYFNWKNLNCIRTSFFCLIK